MTILAILLIVLFWKEIVSAIIAIFAGLLAIIGSIISGIASLFK